MGGRRKGRGTEPNFDIALWGYDRRQVDSCLSQLTTQLEEAGDLLGTVDALQAQLAQAHSEIGELRLAAQVHPPIADRLAGIMHAAEELRRQAAGAGNGEHSGEPVGAVAAQAANPSTE